MLILAAVTITVAINGGLFQQANTAREKTVQEAGREDIAIILAEMQIAKKGQLTLTQIEDEENGIISYSNGKILHVNRIDDETLEVEHQNKYTYTITGINGRIAIAEDVNKTGGIRPVFENHVTTTTGGTVAGGETQVAITVDITNIADYGENYTIKVTDAEGIEKAANGAVIGTEENAGQKSYIVGGGTYTITVTGTATDGIPRTASKTQKISLTIATQFTQANGVIEIIWLNTDNSKSDKPLVPTSGELGGLTAIKWNESNVEGTPSNYTTDWYDYANQKWANAKTNDSNAYFVWIPRYAYKITYFNSAGDATNYRTNGTKANVVGYSTAEGITDQNGNLVKGTAKTVAKGVTTAGYEDYIPHPAFQNGTSVEYKNGEWDEDIKGIWVGKYESSGSTSAVKIVPGVSSLRSTTIGNQYAASQTVKGTYSLAHDSHQMKNSEWRSSGILDRK
jgi:hypothetical protein